MRAHTGAATANRVGSTRDDGAVHSDFKLLSKGGATDISYFGIVVNVMVVVVRGEGNWLRLFRDGSLGTMDGRF